MGMAWGGDEEMAVDCHHHIPEDVVEGTHLHNLEAPLEDHPPEAS